MSQDLKQLSFMNPTFEIQEDRVSASHSILTLKPLENGYGHTLGNALRRILLSSLPGAAITAIRIEGIEHQFSTIKGMKEDVVDFLLNLKQVKIQADNNEQGIARLEVKGPAVVTAEDIKCEAGFSIINPEQHLATLTKDAKLVAEITIESGIGYKVQDQDSDKDIGELLVDSIFSPILNVSYKVEATRVGRRTDFDQLLIDIKTDGTIAAKEALEQAAKILVRQFKQIVDPVLVKEEEPEEELSPKEAEILRLTVEELDLPTRIANALRRGGYQTVRDLVEAEEESVAKVKNIGEKSVKVIAKALERKEVSFNKSN
jgi:DNA-directed RNA polymerase subunit alpha